MTWTKQAPTVPGWYWVKVCRVDSCQACADDIERRTVEILMNDPEIQAMIQAEEQPNAN